MQQRENWNFYKGRTSQTEYGDERHNSTETESCPKEKVMIYRNNVIEQKMPSNFTIEYLNNKIN